MRRGRASLLAQSFTLSAILLGAAMGTRLAAQTLVTYDINALPASVTPASVAPIPALNVFATELTRGGGLVGTFSAMGFNSRSWGGTSVAGSIAGNDYLTFQVAPAANYQFAFTGISSAIQHSAAGPGTADWIYSIDGFANPLAEITSISSGSDTPFNVTGMSNTAVIRAVEFRIVAWNVPAVAASATFKLSATAASRNLTLNGSASLRSAATLTWDGGQGANWDAYNALATDQSSWDLNRTPTAGLADTLVFAGSNQTSPNNNIANLAIAGIQFSSGASPFTVGGNALTVGAGGIVNNDNDTQTVAMDMALGADQSFSATSGNLSITGAVNTNGKALGVGGAFNTTMSGAIGGGGSLSKSGAGILTLTGSNTYGGTTAVSAGVLRLNGTHTGGGAYAVSGTGVLGGTGSTASAVTISLGGTIAPGSGGVGELTTGAQAWGPGGTYEWELSDAAGAPATGWDHLSFTALAVTATSDLGSTFTIKLVAPSPANFDPSQVYSWRIGRTTTPGAISGFDALVVLIDRSGFVGADPSAVFTVTQAGDDIFINYAVPEPGGVGIVVLGVFALRRRGPTKRLSF